LDQIDAWIMVLDTKGINVWCAAGKGTFGTEEIIERVRAVGLEKIVSHRRLILPQLAGPGVSAHKVKSTCGFSVVYGPIRAEDLPEFLAAGNKATAQMRKVRFKLADRVVLIPMELRMSAKYLLFVAFAMFLLAGLSANGYSLNSDMVVAKQSLLILVGGYLVGAAVPVLLLPWLPGRAFSVKGLWVGLAAGLAIVGYSLNNPGVFASRLGVAGWFFMLVAMASFLMMNFTGASTYTSLSGVRREVRRAGPIQALGGLLGLGLWLAERFVYP
jgi:acetyl-CoA decarbonylase/synthase complex subunit gamma